ncbi:MAG TPA: zeta toxin family protein [Arthrobacter sp.]
MSYEDLRPVAAQLDALTAPGAELNRDSALATYDPKVAPSADRVRFQRRLLDDFIEEGEEDVERSGRVAVLVTAGPPGAGKSTAIDSRGLAGDGWRRIDPDEIKRTLLDAAVADGRFEAVFSRTLADGHPIMPNEVSSLVHNESVFLTDRLIERCVEAQENVVIEGTLSWNGLPSRYLGLFSLNDYRKMTILDVEVDMTTALEQAYTRWAEGRTAAIAGEPNGGGRFTPRDAITKIYDAAGEHSFCNKNAVDLFTDPGANDIDVVELIVARPGSDDLRYLRTVGHYRTEVPRYLSDPMPTPTPTLAGTPMGYQLRYPVKKPAP